ncbi:MAG: VIT family protein [Actinomycetaceae bacterium]|nr:VIT family protein [Arcanobacterium sp.]MDD7687275.1 VIT family protein [Actinomycetaceae bacterium]MDY5273553.1 VIT family protein [Arcanobacterium sp.]
MSAITPTPKSQTVPISISTKRPTADTHNCRADSPAGSTAATADTQMASTSATCSDMRPDSDSSSALAVQAAARVPRVYPETIGTDAFDKLVVACASSLDPDSCSACEAIAADTTPLDPVTSQESQMSTKLNWLRAGVLGANDGIVSTAGLVVGVSGASLTGGALLISGVAGLVAGALSMAAGEYVSVSTQRDAERAALARQRQLIECSPEQAERRLAGLIVHSGVSRILAQRMARELTERDALGAHAKFELGIDPTELTNPWHAALSSMASFVLGAVIPLLAIVLTPTWMAVPFTVCAVSLALAITGSVSAKLSEAPIVRATVRNIVWGNLAMIVTYGIGTLVGNLAL